MIICFQLKDDKRVFVGPYLQDDNHNFVVYVNNVKYFLNDLKRIW